MAWAAIWDARGTRMRAPFAAIFMSLACRDCPILAYIGVLLYSENVKREHARRGTTMTTAKQQAWKNDIIERMDASLEEVFSDAKRSGLSEDEAYELISAIARGIAHLTDGFDASKLIQFLGYTKRLESVDVITYAEMGGLSGVYCHTDGRDLPYRISTEKTRERRAAEREAEPSKPAKKIPAYLRKHSK